MVVVELLGAPRIERDGATVEVDTRKAVALLAYLAVTRRAHTRDALAALLWPEYDQEHARGALRRTLSTLRKAVGPEHVESTRERVALKRGAGLHVDVDEFRDRLHSGKAEELAEAVELYRGDFLAGFGVRGSVGFDDWQSFEADSLRRQLAGALDVLAEREAAQGRYGAALAHARRRLALNPLDEPAHRRVIELYARKGERQAAVRQYRDCVRILHSELGVPPVEETTRLYRSIQDQSFSSAPAEMSVPASPVPGLPREGPPLVGRATEWSALLDAYGSVGNDGRLVVVEGEMGIGKTRLAEDFVSSVTDSGAVAISVRCYEDERTLPYAPVAEAARTAVSLLGGPPGDTAAELGRVLPEVAPSSWEPLKSIGAQARFFETVRSVLVGAIADSAPGILFFDDVHSADEASLQFLSYLARRLRGRPMLVLFTWRSEEVPPSHRLRGLLSENVRAGLAATVRPRPLERREVEELASALGAADAAVARTIHRETGGLPLFVVEYALAVARGAAESPPGNVRDLLRARLGSVSEIAAQVLTAAAVVGSRFDAETVRAAGGRTEDETVLALEELTARNLIEEADDQYDFRHEQMRIVTYEDTSLARRRLLHGRVGDALARQTPPGSPLAAQIALHYQLAGQDAQAAAAFLQAGEHARSVYANADALRYFESALALGYDEPGVVHEAMGDVQTLLGEYEAALASYEAAAARTEQDQSPELERKLGSLHLRRGELDLAAGQLEAALASLGESDDRQLHARVLVDLSLLAHRRGEQEQAVNYARKALAITEAADDDAGLAQAHNILGILMKNGREAAARGHFELSLGWADVHADPGARIAALNNLALLDGAEGDFEAAIARMEEAVELCERFGDRHRQAALQNNLADLLHDSGRGEEAMVHLKEAVSIFAEVGGNSEPQPEIWKLVEW
jgi:DNA-binding SARP family transcriptional activator/predicted ATPase